HLLVGRRHYGGQCDARPGHRVRPPRAGRVRRRGGARGAHAGRPAAPARPGSAAMTPTVTVRGLRKRYGATRVFTGLDLDIGVGVTGLLGPNGVGKTTLLRCLATSLAPDAGVVRILGRDPVRTEERVAIRRR